MFSAKMFIVSIETFQKNSFIKSHLNVNTSIYV